MKKYKVLVQLYKKSEKKVYNINDVIELTETEALDLLPNGFIELLEVEDITSKKKRNNQPGK